jgi:NAD+ synthase
MTDFKVRKLDYSQVWENIVSAMCNYLEKNKLESMILGISGGIDSTVNAAIGREVYKRTGKKLIGLSLMTSTNEADEDYAASLVGSEFCTEYVKCSIEHEFKDFDNMCVHISGPSDSVAKGNIKARMRMMILFDASAKHKGIVLSGANQSEVLLGFSTLGADSIGGVAPLSQLMKHEIYEFAHWIKDNIYSGSLALEKSISLNPTDGNGVTAGGDMAQIAPGHTYNDVDDILMTYLEYKGHHPEEYQNAMDELYEKYSYETVERVIRRHLNSQFKRWFLPINIDVETGELIQNNGEPINI